MAKLLIMRVGGENYNEPTHSHMDRGLESSKIFDCHCTGGRGGLLKRLLKGAELGGLDQHIY